jgi:hypothetical protein
MGWEEYFAERLVRIEGSGEERHTWPLLRPMIRPERGFASLAIVRIDVMSMACGLLVVKIAI